MTESPGIFGFGSQPPIPSSIGSLPSSGTATIRTRSVSNISWGDCQVSA
jgi:hypothetical protein